MLRTFLAADLDSQFLDEVAALALRLRGVSRLSGARFVARDAMHVTLRFFGNTDDDQVEALRALVPSLRVQGPVRARSLTGFPDPRRARVVVVELDDGGVLGVRAREAEAAAVRLGFAPETRAYSPHLTLARLRGAPADVRALATEVATLPEGRIVGVTLYASTTAPTGPIYTALT